MHLNFRPIVIFTTVLISTVGLAAPSNAAPRVKVAINKPSAPEIQTISSSAPKKNKVNLTISISLPANNGGATITGSKISAKGATCTMSKLKTTCTIKNAKVGKQFTFTAQSKNKKGFGSKSSPVSYFVNGNNWAQPVSSSSGPAAQTSDPVQNSVPWPSPSPSLAPAPAPAPEPSPVSRKPVITISENTCENATTIRCWYSFRTNEPVSFSWSRYCGNHADGGGDVDAFGFEIYRIGSAATCEMTVTASSAMTGLTTTIDLNILIPGTYPGTFEDYCQPWGTCGAPELTYVSDTCSDSSDISCMMSFRASEDVNYSWSTYCGHTAEGGGHFSNFGFVIFKIGSAGSCPMTLSATSVETGLTTTLDILITIPGTFPGNWNDYCQTSDTCVAPVITVTSNSCTDATGIFCAVDFSINEIVAFSWTTYCGNHADGGGDLDTYGFHIYRIGDLSNCPMTVTATSIATGLTSTLDLVIEIPGTYPGSFEDYCQPYGTCVAPEVTLVSDGCLTSSTVDCFMNFSASEPVEYEWSTYCGHVAEGGGNWDNFGFNVFLIGSVSSCPMSLSAISLSTGMITILEFDILIPGTFPGNWTDYCQTTSSCVGPTITVASDGCATATDVRCFMDFTTNEPVSFTWSQYCGHFADGGGDVDAFGFEIYRIGTAETCNMTVTATSVATGFSSTIELLIHIPGTYPGTWADYPQYFTY